jgi:hypothetical protein
MRERPTRLGRAFSTLHDYVITGVKTQAFVLFLFPATKIETGTQLLMNKRSRCYERAERLPAYRIHTR